MAKMKTVMTFKELIEKTSGWDVTNISHGKWTKDKGGRYIAEITITLRSPKMCHGILKGISSAKEKEKG